MVVVQNAEEEIAGRIALAWEPRPSNLLDDIALLAADQRLDLGGDPIAAVLDVAGVDRVAVGGFESLGDADELCVIIVEDIQQANEVAERPAQAIDLVDDDDVDAAGFNIVEQRL